MKPFKKIIFCLVVFLLICGLIEIFSLASLYLLGIEKSDKKSISVCQNPEADLKIILPPWMTKNVGRFIIHPYLGFIYNPQDIKSTRFGFLDQTLPIQKKSNSKIIVGILGGSSAEILAQFGSDTLKEKLGKLDIFKGKDIVVLNLAIGSYKQPQQLMVLNYILALGGEFDYVINLDGFNEIVLPVLRNIPNKVNPFFPRRWDLKVVDENILGQEIIILGDILRFKKKRVWQSNLVNCGILRFSATARLIIKRLDRKILLDIRDKRMELFNLKSKTNKYSDSIIAHGPDFTYENNDQLYDQLSLFWFRTSKQMSDICLANKIKYFHFLQPCQYVPDSKNMQEEELAIALDPEAVHRQMVIEGYPYLKKQGQRLRKQGVNFYDLTMIFKNYEEPLYIDTFCHFGVKASGIVANVVAKKIEEQLAASSK